jgi:hypothetical protein
LLSLKRRHIFRTALLYVASGWLILQFGDLLVYLMGLPDFALRIVLGILLLGFPIVMIFTGVYEITPDGIKRVSEVERHEAADAAATNKLNVAEIVAVIAAVAILVLDRFVLVAFICTKSRRPEASAVDSAPAAAPGAWSSRPHTWSTACFQRRRSGNVF